MNLCVVWNCAELEKKNIVKNKIKMRKNKNLSQIDILFLISSLCCRGPPPPYTHSSPQRPPVAMSSPPGGLEARGAPKTPGSAYRPPIKRPHLI